MLHDVTLAHDWPGLPGGGDVLAGVRTDHRVMRLARIPAHSYEGSAWHAVPAQGSLAALLLYSLWQRDYACRSRQVWGYRLRLRREFVPPAD